jgi:hypothetical protein
VTVKIVGELEVDIERGVVYFHNYTNGISNLRLSGVRAHLTDFDVASQIDVGIPLVTRSRMPMAELAKKRDAGKRNVKITSFAPKTFFLNEQHTTHISKSQARKERQEYKKQKADIEKEMKQIGKEVWGPADRAAKLAAKKDVHVMRTINRRYMPPAKKGKK